MYNVSEPTIPLKANSSRSLLKLSHEDVGLLIYTLMDEDVRERLLSGEMNINYGSIYENVCAQLLLSHGFDNLYYYNSKRFGEVDFMIEHKGKVVPDQIQNPVLKKCKQASVLAPGIFSIHPVCIRKLLPHSHKSRPHGTGLQAAASPVQAARCPRRRPPCRADRPSGDLQGRLPRPSLSETVSK